MSGRALTRPLKCWRAASPGRYRTVANVRQRPRLGAVECLEDRALLSTIVVQNLDDSGPGSLHAAIEQANLGPDQDTILFAPAARGTLTLTSALPVLSTSMTIAGPGASELTIAGSSSQGIAGHRIFTIDAQSEVEILGLTVSGGFASAGTSGRATGGAISNSGKLDLEGCNFNDNGASNPTDLAVSGGAIDNLGVMSITACRFAGNSADGSYGGDADGRGGAIHNSGTLSVIDSTFHENHARIGFHFGGALPIPGTSFGGAIDNSGILVLSGCNLDGNTADQGGALNNSGAASILGSRVSGNSAHEGGAVSSSGTLQLSGTTIANNTAPYGAGIDNSGVALVSKSAIIANLAAGSKGYSYGSGFHGLLTAPGGNANGGGIYNAGQLTLENSTVSANSAKGGDQGSGPAAGNGLGGGIYTSGPLLLDYATISDNTVAGGAGAASGEAGNARGGGIAVHATQNPMVGMKNSILKNPQGGNVSSDNGIVVRSLGNNLLSDLPPFQLTPSDLERFTDALRTGPRAGTNR